MSKTIDMYNESMLKILKRHFPDISTDKLLNMINQENKKRFMNQEIEFKNSYKQTETTIDLLKFADWKYGKLKPIMSGYGVVFRQHKDPLSINLPASMLNFFLTTRKKTKKEMYKHEHGTEKFKSLDQEQKAYKLQANSYYGASGESNCIFFNYEIGASVTYTGVQIITTAVMAFESFLSNNVLFNNVNDVLIFIERILEEKYLYTSNEIIDEDKLINRELLVEYLLGLIKPIGRNISDEEIISEHIKNLSIDECTKIYYKRNLFKFLENSSIICLLDKIIQFEFLKVDDPPEEIKESLETLWELCGEWVAYKYLYIDRYNRALQDERKSVLVVDTDSNFLNLNPFYEYIMSIYDIEETNENKLSIINIAIYILSKYIQIIFDLFTENCNIEKDMQHTINMKNEFLYSRLMLTSNKKQYVGLLCSQEGNIINPPKLDMKGMSIKKTTVSKTVRDFLTNLLHEKILKEKVIDISYILKEFENLENQIKDSLSSGNLSFAVPANVNSINSYEEPYRQQSVRGVIIWNALFPDKEINPPEKINILKLKCNELEKLRPIFDTPEFDIIKQTIFDDERLAKYGFTVIAVPKDLEQLPSWLIQFVDIETIVFDNIRNGTIMLESLGVKNIEVLQSEYYSNIINF